jgi:hypothetical protein
VTKYAIKYSAATQLSFIVYRILDIGFWTLEKPD